MASKKTTVAKTEDPLTVGNKVFIRTVTNYLTGEVVYTDDQKVLLKDAAWIADTGRFGAALAGGVSALNEIEPYPAACEPVGVNRGSMIDWCIWSHDLPKGVK